MFVYKLKWLHNFQFVYVEIEKDCLQVIQILYIKSKNTRMTKYGELVRNVENY